MKLTKDVVVASRYQLVECLGAGAMGEVWRAQDTRFESRTVAVKFLREDETLKEDALNRDRLIIRLEQQASRGSLNFQSALEAIAAALGASNLEGLRAKAEGTIGTSGAFKPTDVVTVFDELVNDPTFNDNARMRAKLRRLFRDEANAVANLRHDNVVSIFDYGDHEGSPYLVMDYIEGRTLYQVIQSGEMLPQSRKLQLIEDLCSGLSYAHRHKLVHRDIKPANLIIDGSTGGLKILDFGVVRRLGSASTVGVPVGTFCYMSPEQTKGAATLDHRSDIFAVGLVFYELMCGKKAFPPGKSIGDLVARIQRDPPPRLLDLSPSVNKSVEDIINKAIQKLPENRYQDLTLMEREIAKVRARIEAVEHEEGTSVTLAGEQTVIKARPAQPSITDLLAQAEKAFEAGDDNGAIEFAKKVLIVQPGFSPAQGVINRVEARRQDGRVRDLLQQAEKFLALDDLTSAQDVLASARAIDAGSPLVKGFESKLEAAVTTRAAARERLQREREEREREQAREQAERERRLQEQREREQREQREREQRERQAREQAERERLLLEQRAQEQRAQEQRAQEQRAREQQAQEQAERERLLREQAEAEKREREERERRQREERERQEREERARLQREQEQRAQEQRERDKREAEKRERERHEQALRDLARPRDGDPDEPTAVTMQLPRDVIRPPMTTPPSIAKAAQAPPAVSPSRTSQPVAPPPSPPAAVVPPSSGPKTAGPSKKSKRYTARPVSSKSRIPAAPAAPPPQPTPVAAQQPASATPKVTVGVPPVPPAMAAARSGLSPQTIGIAALVVLLLLVAIGGLLWVRSGGTPSPGDPQQQAQTQDPAVPPASTTAPSATPPAATAEPTPPAVVEEVPPADPPAPAMMSTVYIDLRPWARVKIVPGTPNPDIPAETFYVPFAIDLPPGDYNLEAENGGVTRATTFQLKVAEGGPQTFVRSMPGFNATKIVEGLLGQD